MTSLFIDSNVLVYWLHPGSPFNAEVSAFLREAFTWDQSLYVLSSSLNEVYYALHSHYMDERSARASIETVADVFELVDLTSSIVSTALASNEPDYGDGLVRAAAEALAVDAIVSYDRKAFHTSPIPSLTAAEALIAIAGD